ncbi:peroxidase-like protein [Magallana gigas]|uniref:peroxidase-like protein n=1 Tax=Magallana gigas TaxID=29159 RepID=UPI00333F13AA
MKRSLSVSLYVYLVYVPLANGNIDDIVKDAVQSVFLDGKDPGIARFSSAYFRGMGPAPDFKQIPADRMVHGGIAPRPVGERGSGAARALARSGQSNAPDTCALLNDRSEKLSQASRTIAANPEIGSFQRAVSDPQILQSFERACRSYCYEMPKCDFSDPYRRTDGQCNNPINPLLGSSFTPQQRVVPNAYDNLIDAPRTRSVDNSPLPSARTVSNRVFQWTFRGMTPVSAKYSTFLTNHGQFINHDVISTPTETLPTNNPILDCCDPIGGSIKPEACFIIPVNTEERDPWFPPYQKCMHFVRQAGAPPLGCQTGVREQINERTSFVDGSMIYGSDSSRENQLREKSNGRLAEHIENLLPPHPQGCPAEIKATRDCFVAGDHRQSETPTLTVPHITWLRRHNLIADALRNATGITNDETLFQETKRIVIAELQHVTYNEFLPALLSDKTIKAFNLRSRRSGHVDNYNLFIDPRTINAFGVAAYRMGHSLVRNTVGHLGKGRPNTFPIYKHFEVPDLMYEGGYELMARWMSREPKSRSDRFLVDGIRNRLFENFNVMGPSVETPSLDLGALNVQRGRDHGIPSYNAYRQFCGLPKANFFAVTHGGLVNHSPQSARTLQQAYRHPDDIDLFAGGMSETPDGGSILGPTFQCLIAYQFSLYKQGDRFWYERKFQENPVAAFTKAELSQIKKVTYSKVLCSVMNNIGVPHSFQPRLMLRSNIRGNSPLSCKKILRKSTLGFKIKPFTQQLRKLGGNRKGSYSPLSYSRLNQGMRSIIYGPNK